MKEDLLCIYIKDNLIICCCFSLVVQRTKLIDAAQDILLSLLEELTTGICLLYNIPEKSRSCKDCVINFYSVLDSFGALLSKRLMNSPETLFLPISIF